MSPQQTLGRCRGEEEQARKPANEGMYDRFAPRGLGVGYKHGNSIWIISMPLAGSAFLCIGRARIERHHDEGGERLSNHARKEHILVDARAADEARRDDGTGHDRPGRCHKAHGWG